MPIDRSALPEISENIKAFWQPQRTDHSSGGIAYRNPVGSASVDSRSVDSDLAGIDLTGVDVSMRVDSLSLQSHIALISTHGGQRWQLPKGTVEPRETSIQTALREVEEETGLRTEVETFIETVEYWYWDTYNKAVPMLVRKQVDFYLLKVIGGQLSDLSIEVDAVAWFTPGQALGRMTFAAEKETLCKALLI